MLELCYVMKLIFFKQIICVERFIPGSPFINIFAVDSELRRVSVMRYSGHFRCLVAPQFVRCGACQDSGLSRWKGEQN